MDTAALVLVVCALVLQAGANAVVMLDRKQRGRLQTSVGWALAAADVVGAAIVWRVAFP